MTYRIVWLYNGQKYTEYCNFEQLIEVLKFIENHMNCGFIEITEDE